jgi:hypothetical protein
VAGLDLRDGVEAGGARDMTAALPGGIVQPRRHAGLHQGVVGRVELDPVGPLAARIVGLELRWVLVGEPPEVEPLGRAPLRAKARQVLRVGVHAIRPQRVEERPIEGDEVRVLERRGLVEDFVGVEGGGHGRGLWR